MLGLGAALHLEEFQRLLDVRLERDVRVLARGGALGLSAESGARDEASGRTFARAAALPRTLRSRDDVGGGGGEMTTRRLGIHAEVLE